MEGAGNTGSKSPSQFQKVFIQKFEKVHQMISQENDNPEEIIKQVLEYLNNLPGASEILLKGLEHVLSDSLKIEYINNQFQSDQKIQSKDQMERAVQYLYFRLQFEKITQSNSVTQSSINSQLQEIIKQNPASLYWRSFTNKYAVDFLKLGFIVQIVKNSNVSLNKKIESQQEVSLLQKIIMNQQFSKETVKEFTQVVKNQKIDGNLSLSNQTTLNQLYKKRFGINFDLKSKISIMMDCKFQIYQQNGKLEQLHIKQNDSSSLEDQIYKHSYFQQQYKTKQDKIIRIICDNTKIEAVIQQQKYNVRCMFMPPKDTKIQWKLLLAKDLKTIKLSQDTNEKIKEAFSQGNLFFDFKQIGSSENTRLLICDDLIVREENQTENVYGYLVWIPSYKKKSQIGQYNDNEALSYSNQDIIGSQDKASLPPKNQKEFKGLKNLQQQFPSNIDTSSYQSNGMTIICDNPNLIEMFQKFQQDQVSEILSKNHLKGNSYFVYTPKSATDGQKLVKNINRFAKSKNLRQLKAQYLQNQNEVKLHGFRQKDDSHNMFVQRFCDYMVQKETNPTEQVIMKVDPQEMQIINSLKMIAPIDARKIGGSVKIKAAPKVMQIIKQIIKSPIVKQKIDELEALQFFQKDDVEYFQKMKSVQNFSYTKLDSPTFEITCDSIYFAEFISKLYKAKDSLQKMKLQKETVTVTQTQKQEFIVMYDLLKNITGVIIKHNQKIQKDGFKSFDITYPKRFQNLVQKQLNQIRKQIMKKCMSLQHHSATSFTIQNVDSKIAIQIGNVLKKSQQVFKQSPNYKYDNTIDKKSEVSVGIECLKKDEYKFTLPNANQQKTQKFSEDQKVIGDFISVYKQNLNRFSVYRINNFVKNGLYRLNVTEQKTTQQKKAFSVLRNLLDKQLKQLLQKLKQVKLKRLEEEVLSYLSKNFGKKFDPKSYAQFREEFQNSKIQLFKIYFYQNLQNYQKNAKIKPGKINAAKKQIEEIIIPKIQKLQSQLDSKSTILIEDLCSFVKSIELISSIFLNVQLPIVQHLSSFKQKLQKSRIITVKTGTGSGKSTILPPYIIGLGYKKVYVTQPRRLPCQKICERIASQYGNGTVGYRLGGGVSQNPSNNLIYITDGLLKQIIYKDQDFLKQIEVIMLDEVHQQTKNIDLLILLLSKLMHKYPKLKVILCSATVNQGLVQLFDKNLARDTFQVNICSFPVTEHEVINTSILQKVYQLKSKLKNNQQMLVFFPSIAQVLQYQKIFLQEYKTNSYALYGNQKSSLQEQAIKSGQIIFSTSVAQTSLTFPGLKVVVDSQKTRILTYDINQKMLVSKQIKSSKSSKKQRKGRLGRTQPGDYYYIVYKDQSKELQYDLSELDRIQLLDICFELLIKYEDWQVVESQLLKLKVNDIANFKQKINQARETLSKFGNLIFDSASYKISRTCKKQIMSFGNLGNFYYNLVLYQSKKNNCYENMAAVVSFAMCGIPFYPAISALYKGDKSSNCTGDIQVAGNFLMNFAEKMNLSKIKPRNFSQKYFSLKETKNMKHINSIVMRVLFQMKRLLGVNLNSTSCTDWKVVNKIISQVFKNNLYFNRSMIGGNKQYYQKIVDKMIYHPNKPIEVTNQVQFELISSSVLFRKNQKPSFIVALGNTINPFSLCTLSFCCKADIQVLTTKITLQLQQCKQQIGKIDIISEADVYGPVIGFKNNMNINRNGLFINIDGSFAEVVNSYTNLNNQLKKNWDLDIFAWLNDEIADRSLQKNRRSINPEDIIANFEKIQLHKLFLPLKKQFQDLYNVSIRWKNKGKVQIKNASNFHISIFYKKIKGFLSWFVETQVVFQKDMKKHPVQPFFSADYYTKQKYNEMLKRINQIVDPSIDFAILKSWVSGVYQKVHIRTYRMIAVCWVLVNKYDCRIKGGFVRDWIVNGQQKNIPGGPLQNLLVSDPINNFYRIGDETITPSDIDADLSGESPFDYEGFKKYMNKLGIKVEMKQGGWRYLLAFDRNQITGGFTADLIQPYCYISHDKCDFDVNIMYVQGGRLSQIGLKIPLNLIRIKSNKRQEINVKIEQLIHRCQNKKMRKIITNLDHYRPTKFQNRGWAIDNDVYEPVIHQSLKTSLHYLTESQLQTYDPIWVKKMLRQKNYRLGSAELIKNYCFQTGYENAKSWVMNQKSAPNEKLLYHGASEDAVKSISRGGFDSRYFGKAFGQTFGRGAYFADDPIYSDYYVNPNVNKERFMLICYVVLGNKEVLTQPDKSRMSPSPGYHSTYADVEYKQYVIERWGQAMPFIAIKYLDP